MHLFAQTNIQLINQLRDKGYPVTEIGLVLTSYDLAIRLFTGRFRASGKTFIAHLVGTASILASLRVSPTLVAAALIHAAYESGDFGDGGVGISDTRRDLVRSVVGKEVEEYVARYTSLRWNKEAIPAIHGELDALGPFDRGVLLIRLANELEEYLDLGILYCGDERRRQTNYVDHNGQLMVQMAEKLGFPALGNGLESAFKEVAVADIPPLLRGPRAQNFSFVIVPRSYQNLMEALAKRLKVTETAER